MKKTTSIAARLLPAILLLAAMLHSAPAKASQGSCVLPTTGTVSGLTLVQDINACTEAILGMSSGATAPANSTGGLPIRGQLWLDTSTNTVKVYDAVSWLSLGVIDATAHVWQPKIGGGSGTVASATTTDLCSVAASAISITGTTTITSFSNTCTAGESKRLTFAGALILTQSSSLLLPNGGLNITTAASDQAWATYLGGGVWSLIYQPTNGQALSASANFTAAVFFNSVQSPTALASNTNNWDPGSATATSNTVRFSCSSAIIISGIKAPVIDGQILVLDNIGATFACTLTPQDTNSTAGNRFAFPSAVSMGPGSQLAIRYDLTTARWKLLTQQAVAPIAGGYRNLRVFNVATALGDSAPATPATMMKIAADALTVEDVLGNAKRLTTVSCTIDFTGNSFSAGSGGLDTSSLSAPNWYSIWVIYNPVLDITSCLGSLRTTADSTFRGNLPSGYTFYARFGWTYYVNSNSLTQLRRSVQYGRTATWAVTAATNTVALPTITSGSTSGVLTAASVSTVVPPTAAAINFVAALTTASGGNLDVAPNANYSTVSGGNPPPFSNQGQATDRANTQYVLSGWMPLESTSIYWRSSISQSLLQGKGYEDNLN